jgi:hypothetical protein
VAESEERDVHSDVEAEVLPAGEVGSSAQQAMQNKEEEEEKYEPFDCMYAIDVERFDKLSNISSLQQRTCYRNGTRFRCIHSYCKHCTLSGSMSLLSSKRLLYLLR